MATRLFLLPNPTVATELFPLFHILCASYYHSNKRIPQLLLLLASPYYLCTQVML